MYTPAAQKHYFPGSIPSGVGAGPILGLTQKEIGDALLMGFTFAASMGVTYGVTGWLMSLTKKSGFINNNLRYWYATAMALAGVGGENKMVNSVFVGSALGALAPPSPNIVRRPRNQKKRNKRGLPPRRPTRRRAESR